MESPIFYIDFRIGLTQIRIRWLGSYSSSYWGPGVAGFDQVNIKLAAPVRVTGVDSSRGFRIIPFIQLDWAGNTRSEIRRYAGMNAIEDFRIRVGVEAVYRF